MTDLLFEEGFVYPSDETGPYTDLDGHIIDVAGDCVKVITNYGIFPGLFSIRKIQPSPGDQVKIRIYKPFGLVCLDSKIIEWHKHIQHGPIA